MTEDRSEKLLRRHLGELQQLVGQKDAQIHGLHAKIRGYETLGSVCQQKITECQHLELQVKELNAQLALLHTRTYDSDSQREHDASGSNVGTHTDVQCQTETSYLSLSCIDTQSLSLVSLAETGSQPTESALTSQGVVLEFPLSDVSPRSVVETVAQVCNAVKNSVSDTREDTPLSSQLDQLTIAVRKLEKQYFTQQMVVDGLNIENNHLKSTSNEKEQQIVTLREENTGLREQLVSMTAREHALPTAREHTLPADRENAEPVSMQEWVKVEKSSFQTEVVEMEPVLLAATQQAATQEAPLYREIQELQAELGSFKIANDQWKDHSRRIELEHERMTTELHEKLVESQQQVQRLRSEQEHQQQELDRLLMTAKEKLLSEQQLRQECELKLTSVAQLVTRLQTQIEHITRDTTNVEAQVTRLQEQVAEQQQIIQALTDERHSSLNSLASLEANVSGNFTTPESLRTQVALLQQQVVVYKDDFNSERADRVRTQEAKDQVQSQLIRVSADLSDHQSQIAQLQEDLTAARSERIALLREKQEQEEVTCHLQQRVRHLEALQSFQYVNVQSEPPHTPSCEPPHTPSVIQGSQWTCTRCTYSNIGVRATCEMCGNGAPSRLPLMVENMPALPMRFVARNVEQCDAAGDTTSDAPGDETSAKQ